MPGTKDIVAAAEHDKIYLAVNLDDLAGAGITKEQAIDLVRCGVRHDRSNDCLAMFV